MAQAGGLDVMPGEDSHGRDPPLLKVVLPFETPTLNVMLRWHFAERKRWKAKAAWEIKVALCGRLPATPLPRAIVRIVRHGHGRPDHDGLVGGAKLLIDCLLPLGTPYAGGKNRKMIVRHPHGLGIIWDDSPDRLMLEAESRRISREITPHTVVSIWEWTT